VERQPYRIGLTCRPFPARIRGSLSTDPLALGRRPQESESVANIKSAEKRAKQAVKRRAHNVAARSRLRTSVKKVLAAVGAGDRDKAVEAYKDAQPVIDTMVNKGIIHRNKAARHKRELNAKIKAMAAK
jgi:small subunit ribosomal protein S20